MNPSKLEYRWNVTENALGFDAAAEHIHPYYLEIQQRIEDLLPFPNGDDFLVVDAGGGSGRLVERLLRRFPKARAIIFDQSEAFLALAQQRLVAFGERAACKQVRLQEDWPAMLPMQPQAIVSMSAIHHLDSAEKRTFYQRCHDVLTPGGVLLNGDEVRPAADSDYLAECKKRVAHKHRVMEAGLVSAPVCELLRRWEERNVKGFGSPRVSGDDCHETIAAQLNCFLECGFRSADCPWQKDLWAILRGGTA